MFDVLPLDETIAIRAETSVADPDTCKFTVSQTVHPGGPFFFQAKALAAGSPLAERVFALPGVAHVLVAGNVVTVGKDSGTSWSALKSGIGTVIRAQLGSGVPAILEAPRTAGASGRTDAEVRTVIQELLDRQVNRAIAAHGGKISIVDVTDGNLFVIMSGWNCWQMKRLPDIGRCRVAWIRADVGAYPRAATPWGFCENPRHVSGLR